MREVGGKETTTRLLHHPDAFNFTKLRKRKKTRAVPPGSRTHARTHAKLPACGAVWLVPIPWRAIGHRGLVMVASRGAGGLQRGEYCVIRFWRVEGAPWLRDPLID